MSKQKYTICCFFSRRFKQKEAEVPAEIKSLFENYSENGVMNIENLHRFLKEVQGEHKITLEKTDSLLDSFMHQKKNIHISHDKNLTLKQFFRYLLSETNSPLPHPPTVHHDMNAPLSHYFVYTGHNSYLTGNQIWSKCSVVPIIESLKRGVRVIELDMWPNRKKDNVNILHGGTLTASVGLLKCLKAIKKHAFDESPYPVILTLEDHLIPDLQAKVARMLTETFGDKLVHSTPESLDDFPCPESLKGRILISTKPPKTYPATKKTTVKENDDGTIKVNKSSEEFVWGEEIPNLTESLDSKDEESCKDEDDHQDESIPSLQKNAPPEYKDLIAIRNEKMKGGIKAWLRVSSIYAHRVSLNEEKLEKAVLTHGTDIVRFNQRNLMRVYPKGIRINSSNYNPFVGWMHGAQMVAFNMQKHGRPLWLMQGMFRANGGCGYVKKPDCLLNVGSNNKVFDPRQRLPVKKRLKVTVYMGEGWNLDFHKKYFDLCSPPDFYVKIGIAGVPADSIMEKTKTIQDNWIPEWNEKFEFPLTVPELALLRVEVHESDVSGKDDFGGQTCLPISELKTGVRALPLHDYKGVKYKSVKLLMRFVFI